MKKAIAMILKILTIVFFLLGVLISFSAIWLMETWPNLKIGELVFQLTQGFGGAGGDYVGTYIRTCVLPTLVLGAILLAGIYIVRNRKKTVLWAEMIFTSILSIAISVSYVYTKLDAGTYITSRNVESEFIYDHYADPKKTAIVFPQQKRNLIYIYLESMETTYTDAENGGGFLFDCIPELTAAAKANEDFSGLDEKLNGGYSMPDTTWTMAAIFAETAGLPLQTSVDANTMDRQDAFFPGIVTLGDILEDHGYHNEFLIGSDASFAGRDLYFTSHGNYDIHDYDYAEENHLIPEDYYVWWGYEDKILFDIARQDLDTLSASEEPFNLTILTVDTHFEDGYVCDECEEEFGENQYANVMACSSKQVSEFLAWCTEQEWYANTTIILSGDHPTMDTDFCAEVSKDYPRRVYTAFINPAVANADPQRNRVYTTFDYFPTTLAAMGVFIEGDRLGLGTNLFSGKDTLTEQIGVQEVRSNLLLRSKFMEQMSGIVIHARDYEERGNRLVDGSVQSVSYDPEKEELKINIDDITAGTGAVHSVMVITENENGRIYQPALPETDGSFTAILNIKPDQLESTRLKVNATTKENGRLEGSSIFEYSDDNLLFIGSVQNDAAGFIRMVNNLDYEKYTVFMSARGDVSAGMSDEIQQALYDNGCETDLKNQPGISYFFVRDRDGVYEMSSDSYLEKYGYTADWFAFDIISSNGQSAILINDRVRGLRDYSPDEDGLNFVIWDNENRTSVCEAVFDTVTPLPSANVKIGRIQKTEQILEVSVENLQNTVNPLRISAVIMDKENPAVIHSAALTKEDSNIWRANLDITGIHPENCLLKIIVADRLGVADTLRIVDGSLYDYAAKHPGQTITGNEETKP